MDNKLNKAQLAFIHALLRRMKTKPYETITISELSEEAQYDRRTFYRYFQTKNDILYSYCAFILGHMADDMRREPMTPYSGFLAYFKFWSDQRNFLSLLDKHHLLYFLGEKQDQLFYHNVGVIVHNDLPQELEQIPEFSQYAYYFTLGGLWQTLILWIRGGMKQTPEQLTQYVLDIFSQMHELL